MGIFGSSSLTILAIKNDKISSTIKKITPTLRLCFISKFYQPFRGINYLLVVKELRAAPILLTSCGITFFCTPEKPKTSACL